MSGEGRAYLYLGSPMGLPTTGPNWTADPTDQSFARFAAAVAAVGDVNRDGYSDVIIGARFADGAFTSEGHAYLYYGNGGRGLSRRPHQELTNGQPLALLGSVGSGEPRFLLKLNIRTPMGSIVAQTRLRGYGSLTR